MVFWKLFCLILLCLLLFLSYWSFACILRFLIMFLWVLFVCVCFLVFFFSFLKKNLVCFLFACLFLEWERKMTRSWVAEGVRMIREEMGEPWSEPTVQKNIIFNKKKSQNVKYIEHVVQWPPDLDSQQRLPMFFQCYVPSLLGAALSMEIWSIYQQEMTSQISGQHWIKA